MSVKYRDIKITKDLEIKQTKFTSVGEEKYGSYTAHPYDIPIHHIDKYYVHTQGYAYAIVSYESPDELTTKINNLIKVFARKHLRIANNHKAYSDRIFNLLLEV